jgi:hypothetical protein
MTISINHRFDRRLESGFVRAYDFHAARRQFKISVALIVILTMAAFAFGFTARPDMPAGHAPASSGPHKTLFAGIDIRVAS